jgi:3-dehydroquinate synthase
VINDLNLLDLFDERDWRAGMSEAAKVALIKDAAFF